MRDRNFEWMRKKVIIIPAFSSGLITPAVNEGADAASFDEGELFQEPTSADPEVAEGKMVEISTFGLVGLNFNAALKDYHFLWHIPFDFDPRFLLGFRIRGVTAETAAADGATYRLRHTLVKKDVALAQGAATGLVPGNIAGNGTAFSNQRGDRITLDLSSSLVQTDIENGAILTLELRWSFLIGTTTAAENICTGLELDYVPQKCIGEGVTSKLGLSSTGI